MRKFFENKVFVVTAVLLLLVLLVAILAPVLAPTDPLEIDATDALANSSATHLMGTDTYGRDVFSRVLYGLRPSLVVALGASLLAMLGGLVFGMLSAYLGGAFEVIVMRVVDIIQCFPPILLALMISAFWGGGIVNLILIIGIVYMPTFARLAYGQTLQVREQEYVTAQISLGANFFRVLLRGVLPNILSVMIVQFSLTFGQTILLESGLSFLGVGVAPPTPSLGAMIGEAQGVLRRQPMFILWPAVTLASIVVIINFLGDSLRDILDPKT